MIPRSARSSLRRHAVSAVILTRNEESFIGRCLRSIEGLADKIVVRVPGREIPQEGVLIHWRGFTIVEQVTRFTTYAPLEADVMTTEARRVSVISLLWRPVLRFGWCYFVCGGLRPGARGFAHALMAASSEFLRHAVLWERQHAPALQHPPADLAAAFSLNPASTMPARHTDNASVTIAESSQTGGAVATVE